jgi:hypothetical protein
MLSLPLNQTSQDEKNDTIMQVIVILT